MAKDPGFARTRSYGDRTLLAKRKFTSEGLNQDDIAEVSNIADTLFKTEVLPQLEKAARAYKARGHTPGQISEQMDLPLSYVRRLIG